MSASKLPLIDHAAVEAAMRGERPKLRPTERREAVRRLVGLEESNKEIARLLGMDESNVRRLKRPPRPKSERVKRAPKREPGAVVEKAPIPPPSRCGCKCLRINHKGAGKCAVCGCPKFHQEVQALAITIPDGRGPNLSVRTIQARERTAHGLQLIAGGMPVAMAARESGAHERALYRALEARRKAA